MESWWTKTDAQAEGQSKSRAVAYYRSATVISEKNSVEIQQDKVRAFATKHHIEIIHEFVDRGKSGLTATGRPAFMEMIDWVRRRHDFRLVLVQDVSRWGRFPDRNLAAHYESLCGQYGKRLICTNMGFTHDEDHLVNQRRKSMERYSPKRGESSCHPPRSR